MPSEPGRPAAAWADVGVVAAPSAVSAVAPAVPAVAAAFPAAGESARAVSLRSRVSSPVCLPAIALASLGRMSLYAAECAGTFPTSSSKSAR